MSPAVKSKVRVLIVEDSPLMQQMLRHIFSQDPTFEVIGTADDAKSALEAVVNLKPDVVTMDIQIKRSNGLEVTREIMQSTPVPIVVISTSCQAGDTHIALEIVQAGALAAMPKPPAINHPEFAKTAASLRQIVKDMSAVKVVKRRLSSKKETIADIPQISKPTSKSAAAQYGVLAIGASTGGPPAVMSLLRELSTKIPIPVLLVQHIYPGFAPGLVEWLIAETSWKVELLSKNAKAQPGRVYLCENGFQMGIRADGTITVEQQNGDTHHCPSVSHLFSTVAGSFGARSIGIILSGMGSDGAEELKTMREKGALTIAQDKKSAILYGMPGEAAKLNAAEYILSPTATARLINQLFGTHKL